MFLVKSSTEFAGDDMDKGWEIHSKVRRQPHSGEDLLLYT